MCLGFGFRVCKLVQVQKDVHLGFPPPTFFSLESFLTKFREHTELIVQSLHLFPGDSKVMGSTGFQARL